MMLCTILIFLFFFVFTQSQEQRHGYSGEPVARQRLCNIQNHIWYPANGAGIPDVMCRKAYTYMKEQRGDPTYQFVQDNEYSANAGIYYNDLEFVQRRIVPNLLCSAGSKRKAGMSLSGKWQTNKIDYNKKGSNFTIEYCATAAHDPSFWQVFVTKPSFDVSAQELTWSDLDLIWESHNVKLISASVPNCGSSKIYQLLNVPLPLNIPKAQPFIYYIRWQRIDSAGEGFYNCVDMEYI